MKGINNYRSVALVFQEVTIDSNSGGNWNAAKNSRHKGRSLDETGLEVATCRHYLGQKAINIFQGELFGQPLFLIKEFMVPNKIEYCFAEIMCKLWKFIGQHESNIQKSTKPALSVMHANGHAFECQVFLSIFELL